MSLTKEFQEIINDIGMPQNSMPLSVEKLSTLGECVPGTIKEFWAACGIGSFFDGLFQMCDPVKFASILPLIFKSDKDFDHRDCVVLAYTAFGYLYIWSRRHGVVRIDLPRGMVFSRTLAPTVFKGEQADAVLADNDERTVLSIFPFSADDVDYADVDGKPMFERCRKEYGSLASGECYGFFPALALSGRGQSAGRVENIKRVEALGHFTILAQLDTFHLTKLSPDGFAAVRPIG